MTTYTHRVYMVVMAGLAGTLVGELLIGAFMLNPILLTVVFVAAIIGFVAALLADEYL